MTNVDYNNISCKGLELLFEKLESQSKELNLNT